MCNSSNSLAHKYNIGTYIAEEYDTQGSEQVRDFFKNIILLFIIMLMYVQFSYVILIILYFRIVL